MSSVKLKPQWDLWRRKRRADLRRTGMAEERANEFALKEAIDRQGIAVHTGDRAAMEAELIPTPGKVGFSIILDPALIDKETRDSAAKALNPGIVMSPDVWDAF
jgi:hypothetical protein